MMKRILGMFVVVLFVATSTFAGQGPGGTIAGTALNANKVVLTGVRVQLRNSVTGQLVGTTQSGLNGAFSFAGLNPGSFVVEIVNAAGQVIGVSTSLTLVAGGVISGITVAASAAGALAGAAAAGGLASFFTTTGGILVLAGAGALATAGIIVAANAPTASPSR
ncbi:MAG: carboxypeptidase-like regulatory domain-containing protein [Acidobacteria bacterium]|nr:carboxypeptidase-like regulatory domain-containing protein [Acidobacteriota bacterium]